MKIKASFDSTLRDTKLRMLKLHYDAQVGHLGSNLSCIDAMMTIYHHALKDKDQFVLSKGHSAGALYSTLWSLGKISEETLCTFAQDGTTIPGHPSGSKIPGLLFPTGSLGHGLSLSAGLALSKKFKKEEGQVFCLCSDGEFQEGSSWEGIIFSAHNKLDNLILMIDQNRLQGFGTTHETVSFSDLTSRLAAFDAEVQSIDGHCPKGILRSLAQIKKNKLNVIILNTTKGKGLHNEDQLECHYLPLKTIEYLQAVKTISKE
ncbi:1-deoxy-D-xylulose-5-phosphate synthase N-terminal domain-containing protein [Gammaproteobacteria bacterium]|jgi:transketolase|nr:1-deoxy-D-xylulose-5-phosphate synthase N-terminal domain-containing protein [Gammaproteobacteria bacterium]